MPNPQRAPGAPLPLGCTRSSRGRDVTCTQAWTRLLGAAPPRERWPLSHTACEARSVPGSGDDVVARRKVLAAWNFPPSEVCSAGWQRTMPPPRGRTWGSFILTELLRCASHCATCYAGWRVSSVGVCPSRGTLVGKTCTNLCPPPRPKKETANATN